MSYPNRVWEMGGVTAAGRQLWWSREPTSDDHKRRRELKRQYEERQEAKRGSKTA